MSVNRTTPTGDPDFRTLARLCEAPGIPGREERVRALIRDALDGLVDEIRVDAMGNLVARKVGPEGAPRVMVSAHMDEIGFVVRHVDENGFLRLHNLGGFDRRNLFARHVAVHGRQERPLIGVLNPAGKPLHVSSAEDRKKIPEMAEFTVDLGLDADAVRGQVRVGDMVTLLQPFHDLGPVVSGKALDDRSGCWILLETLKRLRTPRVELLAVFSTQEEVGLRGATTGAYALEPDLGIALDTTLAIDTPGTAPHEAITRLGGGVALKVSDGRSISQGWLVDALAELAEARDIPHQFEVLPSGGTDAGAIQRSRGGVPSVTLSTPSRYIHTPAEMVAKRDLEAAVALLAAALESDLAERSPSG